MIFAAVTVLSVGFAAAIAYVIGSREATNNVINAWDEYEENNENI